MVTMVQLGLNLDSEMKDYHSVEVTDESQPVRQLLLVPPDLLDHVWPHVQPLLMEGKKYWEEWATIESIYKGIAEGRMQLWLMNDDEEFMLAMLSEILESPVRKTLQITWLGGQDLGKAQELFLDYVELWASREGVSRVSLHGRKGLVRKLSPHGYELKRYVISKDISGIREH